MALYQLTLFYKNLKSEQSSVRKFHEEVRLVAGKNFRVLSPGEQVCAIGFESDKSPDQLRGHFQGLGTDTLCFLLVEIAEPVTGWMSTDVWTWLASHGGKK